MGHTRYRHYVMFAATGVVLVLDCLLLLAGVRALSTSVAAWQSYLSALASPLGLIFVVLMLVGTLFFALRWLRVGAKIPGVLLGNLQSTTMPLILVGHFAGFITITLVLIVLLSGIVV
jgi:fumarate reductase subunit C